MVIQTGTLTIVGDGRCVTAHGGHVVFEEVIRKIGLRQAADAYLPPPGSGRGISPGMKLSTMVHMLIAGGSCFSDVHMLKADGLFRDVDLPAERTLNKFTHRIGEPDGLEGMNRVHRHVLAKFLGSRAQRRKRKRKFTLDIDDTFIRARKEGAMVSYLHEPGFWATTGYLDGVDLMVAERIRDGNFRPGAEAVAFLEACKRNMPEGCVIGLLRGDSAYHQFDVFQWCHQNNVGFVIAVRNDVAVQALADRLPRKAWKPFTDGDCQAWLAEGMHTMSRPKQPPLTFRVVYLCRSKDGKLPDYPSSECHAYATTLKSKPKRVLKRYRRRGEMENRIKEWKSDLSAERLPCTSKDANAAWLRIATIAYNLHIGVSRKLFPTLRLRLKTVRWQVLQIAGTIIRHARSWQLRVADEHYHKLCEWQAALEKAFSS